MKRTKGRNRSPSPLVSRRVVKAAPEADLETEGTSNKGKEKDGSRKSSKSTTKGATGEDDWRPSYVQR